MTERTAEPGDAPDRNAPSVRRRLLLMAASLVAPAIIFMGFLIQAEYRESRERYEDQLVAMTRALSLATDRQIAQGQATLQALAVSPSLQKEDFAQFEVQARGAVAGKPGWIVLLDGQSRQLLNTLAAPGAPLPTGGVTAATWRELRAGRTVVSNLTPGPVAGRPIIAIEMPVVIGGHLHDLAYVQDPAALRTLFAAQGLPATWTGSIVDRNAILVARSREHDRFVGQSASPDMRQALARASEGVVATKTLDGTPTLSAFSRSPAYGWTFIVGVPQTELNQATFRAAGQLSLAMASLLAIGAALALAFSQRISREVRSLMADAQAIAAGGVVEMRRRDLLETSEVRRALRLASIQLRDREADRAKASARQQLMINELNHRVKNTLATVQSLARQSLGRADGDGRVARFTDRLLALARAHDLLTLRVWEHAPLGEVVAQTLEPYGARALADGPPVLLAPNAAVTLVMVFHELATNAVKYGALGCADGRVAVTWSLTAASELELVWRESHGPPVVAEARGTGFGSRLIRASVEIELNGRLAVNFAPDGLVCTIVLPLSDRVRPAEA